MQDAVAMTTGPRGFVRFTSGSGATDGTIDSDGTRDGDGGKIQGPPPVPTTAFGRVSSRWISLLRCHLRVSQMLSLLESGRQAHQMETRGSSDCLGCAASCWTMHLKGALSPHELSAQLLLIRDCIETHPPRSLLLRLELHVVNPAAPRTTNIMGRLDLARRIKKPTLTEDQYRHSIRRRTGD